MRHFAPEPLHSLMDLGKGVTAVFHEAGHILGSAITEINVRQEDGRNRRIVFSGDLGQPGRPLEPPSEAVACADILLIESTYADRDHPHVENVTGRLKGYFEDIHHQNARLIIPAFSVGRTQHILWLLNRLFKAGRIPPTPVVVDSPLSHRATQVYDRHRGNFDAATLDLLRAGQNPLAFPGLRFIESIDESMSLKKTRGPMVIISASGMCEGGRVLHHLKNNIGDSRNVILIVGFQAENTLGRRLVEHKKVVKILGDTCRVRARVQTINALSAHADRGALAAWFDAMDGASVSRAFAVHGEEQQVGAMVQLLREHGAKHVDVPAPGQRFENV
ncbi:MAG: MBL fold metallo-hydrolase, partial [Kiritimatiellaeota bacterium]|nr:MBL fold metallo-hydrolase [Kiritimatiellota bacterium]